MLSLLNLLSNSKTYIAAAGLIGLATYQASQGQYSEASQSFLGALAAVGLHGAIVNPTTSK